MYSGFTCFCVFFTHSPILSIWDNTPNFCTMVPLISQNHFKFLCFVIFSIWNSILYIFYPQWQPLKPLHHLEQPLLPRLLEQPLFPRLLEQPHLPRLLEQPHLPRLLKHPLLPRLLKQPLLPDCWNSYPTCCHCSWSRHSCGPLQGQEEEAKASNQQNPECQIWKWGKWFEVETGRKHLKEG